jgi:hypothetical protein
MRALYVVYSARYSFHGGANSARAVMACGTPGIDMRALTDVVMGSLASVPARNSAFSANRSGVLVIRGSARGL